MNRYGVFCFLSRIILKAFFRIEIHGTENIPDDGPFIIAPNHVSFIDPVAAGAFIRRDVYYMARESLFSIPFLGALITWCNAFPVRRQSPGPRAMRRALSVLKSGSGLLVFPEGRRSTDGKIQEGNAGVGMLAVSAGAPVVPVLLLGTDRALPVNAIWIRSVKISVYYCEPVYPPGCRSRGVYRRIMEEAMKRIRDKRKEVERCLRK